MSQYADGFVLPVPKANLEACRRMAVEADQVWREHGALEHIECIADDVKPGEISSNCAGRRYAGCMGGGNH